MGGVRVLQLDETPPHGSQTNQAGPEQHQAARLRSRLAIGHQNHILFVVRVDGVVESNEGQSRRDVAVTEIKQNIVPRDDPQVDQALQVDWIDEATKSLVRIASV